MDGTNLVARIAISRKTKYVTKFHAYGIRKGVFLLDVGSFLSTRKKYCGKNYNNIFIILQYTEISTFLLKC